jgi:flagellar motor protein MotB
MKTLTFRSFLVFALSLSLSTGSAGTGYPIKNSSPGINILQPRKAKKAQKKQDAREKKKKSAIKNSSKLAQKRSYEIQSPEVQARMKQNKKDAVARDKARKKNNRAGTKKGAKKYR